MERQQNKKEQNLLQLFLVIPTFDQSRIVRNTVTPNVFSVSIARYIYFSSDWVNSEQIKKQQTSQISLKVYYNHPNHVYIHYMTGKHIPLPTSLIIS